MTGYLPTALAAALYFWQAIILTKNGDFTMAGAFAAWATANVMLCLRG